MNLEWIEKWESTKCRNESRNSPDMNVLILFSDVWAPRRAGWEGGACKHLRWLNCWLEFSGPLQKSVQWIGWERFSCRWQRSVDCVFCAVNNKVRTYAHGKLMSNHKDLGKSFASGHGLLTLAGRGPRGRAGKRWYCKAVSGRRRNKGCTAHITMRHQD